MQSVQYCYWASGGRGDLCLLCRSYIKDVGWLRILCIKDYLYVLEFFFKFLILIFSVDNSVRPLNIRVSSITPSFVCLRLSVKDFFWCAILQGLCC